MLTELAAALTGIRTELDWVAAALLRFVRANAGLYRSILDSDDDLSELVRSRRGAIRWLRQRGVRDGLDDELLDGFRDDLLAHAQVLGLTGDPDRACVLVARAAAEAIDHLAGARFWEWYRRRGLVELAEGDPCPIAPLDKKALFGALTPNPSNFGPSIDRTRHLCIVPPLTHGHRLRHSSQLIDEVRALHERSSVGFVIPGDPTNDALAAELDHGPPERFFEVRPVDPEANAELVRDRLDTVARLNAQIVLLPELCLGPDLQRALDSDFAHLPGSVDLLVAGSVHEVVDGAPRNVARLITGAATAEQHHKFNRFVWKRDERDYTEGIEISPSVITLYAAGGGRSAAGHGWTFCPLICKDMIEPGVTELLEHVQPSMLLVVALSSTTAPFEARSAQLCSAAQTIVAVANHTPDADRDPFIVWLQRPHPGEPRTVIRRSETAPPHHEIVPIVPK